jgi:hypothetical protein
MLPKDRNRSFDASTSLSASPLRTLRLPAFALRQQSFGAARAQRQPAQDLFEKPFDASTTRLRPSAARA